VSANRESSSTRIPRGEIFVRDSRERPRAASASSPTPEPRRTP
jgi:hypothetical protein